MKHGLPTPPRGPPIAAYGIPEFGIAHGSKEDSIAYRVWLDAFVAPAEAAKLRGVSFATLERMVRAGKIPTKQLSPRRIGVRRRHALMLDE